MNLKVRQFKHDNLLFAFALTYSLTVSKTLQLEKGSVVFVLHQ